MKKSVAAAIIAATPMALTGLVNAEGSGGGSASATDGTGSNPDTTSPAITTTIWFEETTIAATQMECDPAQYVRVKKKKNNSQWECQDATKCYYAGGWHYHKRSGFENSPWELCDYECSGDLVTALLEPPCKKLVQ